MKWKPINTAPKDYTKILAYSPGDEEICSVIEIVAWRCYKHFRIWNADCHHYFPHNNPNKKCKYEWIGYGRYGVGVNFTHWMPLPKPPKS
jgi:hypothetical protein